MGYQESFRPIEHLAESAGIKKAIAEYADNPYLPEHCVYFCSTREKATGKLFACIGGQRCRVHIIAGIDIDFCVPDDEPYEDYYEDLDERLVEEAALERPDLVEQAYHEVVARLERAAKRERQREGALREESMALWPDVSRVLALCGPIPAASFVRMPMFTGHFMYDVLVDLERQGLVSFDRTVCPSTVSLTEKALQELGIEEVSTAKDLGEQLVLLLEAFGPLSSANLSQMLGLSMYKLRPLLRKLVSDGRIIPQGQTRSRKYRVAEDAASVA